MSNSKEMTAFGNWIKNKILKYELVLLLLIAACLMMKNGHIPFSGYISVISFSIIASIYIFSTFASHEESDITASDLFIYKIAAFGSSTALIGILFTILHWPNSFQMIITGLPTLSISLIYIMYQKSKRPEMNLFNSWLIIRFVALLLIAAGYLFVLL